MRIQVLGDQPGHCQPLPAPPDVPPVRLGERAIAQDSLTLLVSLISGRGSRTRSVPAAVYSPARVVHRRMGQPRRRRARPEVEKRHLPSGHIHCGEPLPRERSRRPRRRVRERVPEAPRTCRIRPPGEQPAVHRPLDTTLYMGLVEAVPRGDDPHGHGHSIMPKLGAGRPCVELGHRIEDSPRRRGGPKLRDRTGPAVRDARVPARDAPDAARNGRRREPRCGPRGRAPVSHDDSPAGAPHRRLSPRHTAMAVCPTLCPTPVHGRRQRASECARCTRRSPASYPLLLLLRLEFRGGGDWFKSSNAHHCCV